MAVLTPQQKAEFVSRIVDWLLDNDEFHTFIAEQAEAYLLEEMSDDPTDDEVAEQLELSVKIQQEVTEAVIGALTGLTK